MPLLTASLRMLESLVVVFALVAPVAAIAGPDAAPGCLNPAQVRGWSLLPDDHVLVDAGRQRFVIELAEACPGLDHNPFLGFISQRPDSRVCGQRGDQLVPHGSAAGARPPCPIHRLRLVEEIEYANERQRRVQSNGIGS